MTTKTLTTTGAAILGAGLALIISAAALAFQNGMIADATNGVGVTTPVEYAMFIIGFVLTVAGAIMLPLAARRRAHELTRS